MQSDYEARMRRIEQQLQELLDLARRLLAQQTAQGQQQTQILGQTNQ